MALSVEVKLRSQHVAFLEGIAEREDTSLSGAFGMILQRFADALEEPPRRRAMKTRAHLHIDEAALAVLNTLADRRGLSRSDVARRLIDSAMARD